MFSFATKRNLNQKTGFDLDLCLSELCFFWLYWQGLLSNLNNLHIKGHLAKKVGKMVGKILM